jgi:hypothetical protein
MLSHFLKYKFVSIVSAISILFALGGFLWAYFALHALGSGPLILHFEDIDGITAIGGLSQIVFMGVFGIVVTVIDGLIALEFESRNAFWGKLVAVMTLLFAILLFIGFASIISVN